MHHQEIELMTPQEVEQLLGYGPRAMANMRANHRGPVFIRLPNGHVRYRRSDVDHWLLSNGIVDPAQLQESA